MKSLSDGGFQNRSSNLQEGILNFDSSPLAASFLINPLSRVIRAIFRRCLVQVPCFYFHLTANSCPQMPWPNVPQSSPWLTRPPTKPPCCAPLHAWLAAKSHATQLCLLCNARSSAPNSKPSRVSLRHRNIWKHLKQ